MKPVGSVEEACAWAVDTLRRHPECDAEAALLKAYAGEKREHAAFGLGHWYRVDDDSVDPEADAFVVPPVADFGPPDDVKLARDVVGILNPLGMVNPTTLAFGTGFGTGTLPAAFGAELDPNLGYAVRKSLTLEAALARPEPDPATAGFMPQIHERIRFLDERLSPEFAIRIPDVQGPFNIAHSVLGENVFYAPYDDPEAFYEFMARVTRHWVGVQKQVLSWIGSRRKTLLSGKLPYLAECSVNLVSPDFYNKFILPHDRAGAAAFDEIHIHPCSGPHVFKATWEGIPNVRVTEAGSMEHRMAAGTITVEDALAMIGDRPVLLSIGQELPEGREFETIASHFDRYPANRRLVFGYTGTHWFKKDRPLIRTLHRRLNEYFAALP